MNDLAELYLCLGQLLGMLLRPEGPESFIAVLGSDEPGNERIWRYTQRLRDELTDALRKAGRE